MPNLKVYLYNQILDSLRITKKEDSILLQIHQLMDHVNILQQKGFFSQSLKVLKRLKNLASTYHQLSFLFQALVMERKLALLCSTITLEKSNQLSQEIAWCSQQLSLTGQLSNQSMLFYGWYNKGGCLNSDEEKEKADTIFVSCCEGDGVGLSFYPRLYFLQAKTYYFQLTDNPSDWHQAATEWVEHFQQNPQMLEVETIQFQRGLFYLNRAALRYGKTNDLYNTANVLGKGSDHFYRLSSALNCSLFEKQASEAILRETYLHVQQLNNPARLLLLCWQAATICFQQTKYESANDFIRVALHQKTSEARIDLQYALRLMEIEVHQHWGHDSVVESLVLSARRFAQNHKLMIDCKSVLDS